MTWFRAVLPASCSLWILLLVVVQQPPTTLAEQTDPLNPYNNPTIGATLEHYDVDRTNNTKSAFTCKDGGARCVFRRSHFSSLSFGSGQNSEVVGEGAVWAATVDGAVLTLGNCNVTDFGDSARGACVVTCNANCTCALTADDDPSTTQPCTEVASRAPTPAPRTEPTAMAGTPSSSSTQCPNRIFDEFCGELMHGPGLPPGIEENYECYNFCGGIFVSSCDLSGQCGDSSCSNSTASGTINGEVQGCTYQDYLNFHNSAPSTAKTTSGTTVGRMPFAGIGQWIALFAAGGTVMLW